LKAGLVGSQIGLHLSEHEQIALSLNQVRHHYGPEPPRRLSGSTLRMLNAVDAIRLLAARSAIDEVAAPREDTLSWHFHFRSS
jgi:hypothetical protein